MGNYCNVVIFKGGAWKVCESLLERIGKEKVVLEQAVCQIQQACTPTSVCVCACVYINYFISLLIAFSH